MGRSEVRVRVSGISITEKLEASTAVTVNSPTTSASSHAVPGSAVASLTLINMGVLRGYRWHKYARIWRTPLLGELFKTRSVDKVKTNLMVFIRPRILRDGVDAAIETNAKYNYLRKEQSEAFGRCAQAESVATDRRCAATAVVAVSLAWNLGQYVRWASTSSDLNYRASREVGQQLAEGGRMVPFDELSGLLGVSGAEVRLFAILPCGLDEATKIVLAADASGGSKAQSLLLGVQAAVTALHVY